MKKLFLLGAVLFSPALAKAPCHGRLLNPITDVCWSCVLPLSIGPHKVAPGRHADVQNPHSLVCTCGEGASLRIGLAMGFWEPISLVDVTRTPLCFVNMGGFQAFSSDYYPEGVEDTQATRRQGFYHVHWYHYPIFSLLKLLTDFSCMDTGDWDLAYLSEFDPLWQDEILSFILNPEAILFNTPIAQAACAVDALAASTRIGLDSLFWCLGAQGSTYPLTGTVTGHAGGVEASTLLSERMAFKLHRSLLLWDSRGKMGKGLCHLHPTPILPKSRYRYQMTYPIAAATEPNGCKPFGYTTFDWGMGREFPYKGEDFGYLIFRKRSCCAY